MSDIVERLRGFESAAAQSWAYEAANEIESLRQRMKELEAENAALKSRPIYEPAPYWTNPNWKMPEIT